VSPDPQQLAGVLETVVYGDDIEAMVGFYGTALRLRRVGDIDELGASFRLPSGGMLLVFDAVQAARPGRTVPSHGTDGAGHVAFSVPPGTLDAWRRRLVDHGLEIEQDVEWGNASRSVYLRDPAGNSVELVDGDPWPA
jgi:catechol 2,3-dioxygenase-like lactoylglutathione lyase family enzyme